MASLRVYKRNGDLVEIDARVGVSIMENIRDSGVHDILALCGGCCSCATCHIHVEADALAKLPAIDEQEECLLEGLDQRNSGSRLSCQIIFEDKLDGLTLRIAQDE
jgi:2Fe-2S ferredoxin